MDKELEPKLMQIPNPAFTSTYLKLEFVWIRPENERESAGAYRNVINVVDDQMLIFDPQEQKHGVKF
jgi:predicted nucleic-acid-binding protein